ncbi:MAG: hypothetical protein ACOCQD_00090 [archaeon]
MPKGIKKLTPVDNKKNYNSDELENTISQAVEKSMEKVFEKQNKKQKLEQIFGEKEVKEAKKESDGRKKSGNMNKSGNSKSEHDHIQCIGCGSDNIEKTGHEKIEICPDCNDMWLNKDAQYGVDYYICTNCNSPVPVEYLGSNKNCPTCGHDKVK